MAQAQNGDKVTISYTAKLADGSVFDSTHEHDGCESESCGCEGGGPREITLGAGEFLSVVEDALVGMAPGEKKQITIAAEDAFGEYDVERVFTVPRADLPEDLQPEVGDELVLVNDEDEELGVVVVEVTEEEITFDANHPLAGEDVTYDVELVSIL